MVDKIANNIFGGHVGHFRGSKNSRFLAALGMTIFSFAGLNLCFAGWE
jgi:hypothetical protein